MHSRHYERHDRHHRQENIRAAVAVHLLPWGGWLASWPAAAVVNLGMSHAQHAGVYAAVAGLGAGYVGQLTADAAKARGRLMRRAATLFAAGLGGWTVAAGFDAGPWHEPWWPIWLGGLPFLAAGINVLRWLRGHGGDDGFDSFADLVTSVKSIKNMEASQVINGKVVTKMQLQPGARLKELQDDAEGYASGLQVARNGVRFKPDPDQPDNAARAVMEVVPKDYLRVTVPWPGPSHFGGSIADPVNIGIYEDGGPMLFWLPGDPDVPRNASHIIVTGMSGAGKTEGLIILGLEVGTRFDANLVVVDTVKQGQSLGVLEPLCSQPIIKDPKAAGALIQQLVEVETPRRTAALAQAGFKEWVRGCGLPLTVVMIDEAPSVIADNEDVVAAAERCRSAGIIWVFGIQRAHSDRMPTEVRSNCGTVLCFGVKREQDESFALSPDTRDAGARPSAWGNRRPGYSYLEAPGVDEERWATPGRTYKVDPTEAAQVVAEVVQLRPAAVAAPVAEGEVVAPLVPVVHRRDEPPAAPQPEDSDSIDIDQPIEVPDREPTPLGDAARQLPTSQAQAVVDRTIRDLAAGGVGVLRPKDLAELLDEIGRSRAWLSQDLRNRCADPNDPDRLLDLLKDGEYRVRVPVAA